MIRRVVALGLGLLAAGEAAALTCAPPDPYRAFREAEAAPESYVVLHGQLDFDPARMPSGGYDEPGSATGLPSVPARFEGRSLSAQGFATPFSTPITLQPTCAGPWCGGGIVPGEWLLFAHRTAAGYEVEIGACGGWAFDLVSEETLRGLAACMRGAPCGE